MMFTVDFQLPFSCHRVSSAVYLFLIRVVSFISPAAWCALRIGRCFHRVIRFVPCNIPLSSAWTTPLRPCFPSFLSSLFWWNSLVDSRIPHWSNSSKRSMFPLSSYQQHFDHTSLRTYKANKNDSKFLKRIIWLMKQAQNEKKEESSPFFPFLLG